MDNDDFIFKEEDYLNYEINHPLFESFIKSVFSTKVVLFVGYGYSDYNLKIILQKVRNILGKNYQSSYLLTHESFSSYKVNYLKDNGVNVISYKDNEVCIENYITGNNTNSIIYKNTNSKLNSTGQKLLDLITFINNYDRFKEYLSQLNPITQMRKSLERFSEMNTLPHFFIASLYPFNNTSLKLRNNEYGIYTSNISNKNLLDFLNKNTIYNGSETVLSEEYKNIINDKNEINTIQNDLNKVSRKLNFSAITRLSLDYSQRDGLHSSDVILVNKNTSDECDCLTCLMGKLKLNKLIDKIQISDITDASDIQLDAQLAYANYKCGNIYNAYILFEETAQKAWETGKYIIYFISKYNLIQLGKIIDWSEYKNIDNNHLKEIKDKSDSIDLDSVYRQINDVSKEESELLKIIRDDIVLENATNYIHKTLDEIKEIYTNLSKGGSRGGSNPSHIVDFYLYTVDMFYNRNFIVNDVFTPYKSLFNIGIEAILINHKMYSEFSKEENFLDSEFCVSLIHYGSFSNIEKVIKTYKVKDIHLQDDDKNQLYNVIINYFKSFIDENIYSWKPAVNHKIDTKLTKFHLKINLQTISTIYVFYCI